MANSQSDIFENFSMQPCNAMHAPIHEQPGTVRRVNGARLA